MDDAHLDAMIARGERIYAVFVPSAAFVREELFGFAEEAGLRGDGGEAFALVHACSFRSDLVLDLRRWGEIERFPTLREAVAWCRACKVRPLIAQQNDSAAAMILKTLLLYRSMCPSAGPESLQS